MQKVGMPFSTKGERFDAHNFVAQVAANGCQVAIVERPIDAEIAQLVVADTRLALGQLGAYRREQNAQLKVIALTGSSGKTTTKEMLGSILSRLAPTLITRGNLNNDLGVPMMLLELRKEHQYAVMELGANHQGEIDYTSKLVQPHVAGILNIELLIWVSSAGVMAFAALNQKSIVIFYLRALLLFRNKMTLPLRFVKQPKAIKS